MGNNWKSLKSEISKDRLHASETTTIKASLQLLSLSKKKRKDIRKKVQKEAIRVMSVDIKTTGTWATSNSSLAVGLDCEYVGVGFNGAEDQLARVSIVNEVGETLYDTYVKPMESVTDYRTHVSGIQAGHLIRGVPFAQVQQEVHSILANKIVVGHAVHNDFRVLKLSHPFRLTRDTSKYKPFRVAVGMGGGAPSLKLLAEKLLGVRIQEGQHNSIIDARTALRLYMLNRKKWDDQIKQAKKH